MSASESTEYVVETVVGILAGCITALSLVVTAALFIGIPVAVLWMLWSVVAAIVSQVIP